MKVTINQPYFLPYIGLMEKAKFADLFVVNDYSPISLMRRIHRRVKIMEGFKSPTAKFITEWVYSTNDGKPFNKILLDDNFYRRIKEIINSIQHAYARAKFFDYLSDDLFRQLQDPKPKTLGEFNFKLIELLLKKLNIKTKTILASQSGLFDEKDLNMTPDGFKNHGTYMAFRMCQITRATKYISGQSGPKYLDEKPFENNGIGILYQKIGFSSYPQFNFVEKDFLPGLSIIDLIFHCGPGSEKFVGQNSVFLSKI